MPGIETEMVPDERKYQDAARDTQPQAKHVEQGVVALFGEFSEGDREVIMEHDVQCFEIQPPVSEGITFIPHTSCRNIYRLIINSIVKKSLRQDVRFRTVGCAGADGEVCPVPSPQ